MTGPAQMNPSRVDDDLQALRNILGEQGVLTGADAESYEVGARFDHGKAAFVLRPSSTAEVSAVVAYCVQRGIAIIPQSANTGVVSGSTPDNSGSQAVLSLDRLNKRIDIDVTNRSVHVDAGVRLSALNATAEASGLFFPIDLGADPFLGGMLSTNTGGARFLRYGDVRRNTLGLKVVLADNEGTVLDLSQPLRKNNTGIDWKQMFIGTSGGLGIITECVLNLERRPRQTATAMLVPNGLVSINPLLEMLELRLGSYLTAFEGMSKNAIEAAIRNLPSLANPFAGGVVPPYVVLVELTREWDFGKGEQTLDDVLQNVLADILELQQPLLLDALIGHSEQMWTLRHSLPEGVKLDGRLVGCDVSFRRGDSMRFCEWMYKELPQRFPGTIICDFGHIADGGVHFVLVATKGSAEFSDPDFEQEIRRWVYQVVVNDFGGSFSAEHGIGRKNQHYYDLYTPERIKQLGRSIKQMLSPGELGIPRFWSA